jgi:septal ring factor EnvC (AmiA/AmiB activator)
MRVEAKTDRELLIGLDGRIELMDQKIDAFKDSLKDIVNAFNKMETERINDHEKRLVILEKEKNERGGAYKFLIAATIIIGGCISFLTLKSLLHW